jgi:hypothetical protein
MDSWIKLKINGVASFLRDKHATIRNKLATKTSNYITARSLGSRIV